MSKSSAALQQIEAQPIPGFSVAGLSIMTSNKDGAAAEEINALWQRFFEEGMLQKIGPTGDTNLYAVYSDYEGDHTKPFRVTLGCKITSSGDDLPAGLHKVAVSGAPYAIFAARGAQPKALLQTWEGIWKSDLPRAFESDFEVYGPRFFEEGLHEVLVCIGVKP